MKELSLNILDIVENSVSAKAAHVLVTLEESVEKDLLSVLIEDDGCGMDEGLLARVLDPFTTTRSTRNVGLGLPLFKLAAEQAGGGLEIKSQKGKGTTVCATFGLSNIDRAPIGDIADTVATLVQGHGEVRFTFSFLKGENGFSLDTDELTDELGGVPLCTPEVLVWIKEFVRENLAEIEFVN